jgi:hypothetical protein
MGGFRDLLAWMLRWRSAPASAAVSGRVVAGAVWHTGPRTGETFVAGSLLGMTFSTGQTAGQIHG